MVVGPRPLSPPERQDDPYRLADPPVLSPGQRWQIG
jgi:hypothetical protein